MTDAPAPAGGEHEPALPEREQGRPWLTWCAAAACVAATLTTHAAALGRVQLPDWLWPYLRPTAQAVWSGRADLLLFAGFPHGTPTSLGLTALHLGCNLLLLLQVGALLERAMDPLKWVVFFASAVVVSACAELAISSVMPVGVSGVLYAMFGLMWAARWRVASWRAATNRRVMLELVGWGIFSYVASVLLRWPIANGAHAGGLAYGLAVGWLVAEDRRPVLGGIMSVLLGFGVVCALTWMPWSGVWCDWRGRSDLAARRPTEAVYWLKRGVELGQPPVRGWALILEAQRQRGDILGMREAESELAALGVRPARTYYGAPFRLRPAPRPPAGHDWPPASPMRQESVPWQPRFSTPRP